MRESNEAIFRRWVDEVWNKGIEKTLDELFDENGVAVYQYFTGDKPIIGINSYKRFFRQVRENLRDLLFTIEQITSDDNKITAVLSLAANRRGSDKDGLTKYTPVNLTGLWQITVENGKILKIWSNVDWFGQNI